MTRAVFADSFFWIALLNRSDNRHAEAVRLNQSFEKAFFVTTDDVLIEVLNYFSGRGPLFRQKAATLVHRLRARRSVRLIAQTRSLFDAGLALYETRLDKGYSLTDCLSMVTMRDRGVTDVLSDDRHFEQEGFRCLFK